jgi:hypothetical protein
MLGWIMTGAILFGIVELAANNGACGSPARRRGPDALAARRSA